jgi:hypothetical protein
MGDEPVGKKGRGKKARTNHRGDRLSGPVKAQMTRRLALLLGLIPLPQMTQAEADWVFRQKVRLGE